MKQIIIYLLTAAAIVILVWGLADYELSRHRGWAYPQCLAWAIVELLIVGVVIAWLINVLGTE